MQITLCTELLFAALHKQIWMKKCSQEDDWDVDVSAYYQPGIKCEWPFSQCPGGGSKDANDMKDMEMERRLRAGVEGLEP